MGPAVKVFVYGTLKRNYGNHGCLQGATFIGTGETVAPCRLFNAGFPVLRGPNVRKPEHNATVRGEVYDCPPTVVERLDRLEGAGRMYHRKIKLIRLDSDGIVLKASVYVGDTQYWKNRIPLLLPLLDSGHNWGRA
jgi:gamma-glutamylaminecyclotransferase